MFAATLLPPERPEAAVVGVAALGVARGDPRCVANDMRLVGDRREATTRHKALVTAASSGREQA
jgi:hypothetical protein